MKGPIYESSTDSFKDERGEIWTTYKSQKQNIINHVKVNTNKPGVFRGFHADEKTTKICECLDGEMIAYIVNPDNQSYEEYQLSSSKHSRITIPPGFYNGILAIKQSLYIYQLSYEGEYIDADKQLTLSLEESCVPIEVVLRQLRGLTLIRSKRDSAD